MVQLEFFREPCARFWKIFLPQMLSSEVLANIIFLNLPIIPSIHFKKFSVWKKNLFGSTFLPTMLSNLIKNLQQKFFIIDFSNLRGHFFCSWWKKICSRKCPDIFYYILAIFYYIATTKNFLKKCLWLA